MRRKNYFESAIGKVWAGVKLGLEPGAPLGRAASAAWSMRFEVAAAIASELMWVAVRALVAWIFGPVPRPQKARVIRLRPNLRPV